jgi:hypothetical protein
MQLSTNAIMQRIENAFYCTDYHVDEATSKKSESFIDDMGMKHLLYKKDPEIVNINDYFNKTGDAISIAKTKEINTNLKLQRVFAWHNFNKGTLWIKYSFIATNSSGKTITGSWNVPVKLTIERVNGKWEVTDIHEPP